MRGRRLLAGLGIWIGLILLFVVGSLVSFRLQRRADFRGQRERVAALELPVEPGATNPNEKLIDASLPDEAPLDRLRMVATHNSYRSRAGIIRLMFIDLAQRGEADELEYTHPPLWDQLEAGIRSFELDLRWSRRGFECAHVPLVDDRSSVPDFSLALRELTLWADRNPGAAPIVLLLELKDDYRFLDPALKPIGAPELDALDSLLIRTLGAALFRPDDLKGPQKSLSEAVAEWGWPSLGDLRGRFLVILHPNEPYRSLYLSGHPGLAGRAMFTSVNSLDDLRSSGDAVFAVLNDPVAQADEIRRARGLRMIVRTRADADGVRDPWIREAALASGAQIVSTDFPAAYPAKDGYELSLPGGAMLEVRE